MYEGKKGKQRVTVLGSRRRRGVGGGGNKSKWGSREQSGGKIKVGEGGLNDVEAACSALWMTM